MRPNTSAELVAALGPPLSGPASESSQAAALWQQNKWPLLGSLAALLLGIAILIPAAVLSERFTADLAARGLTTNAVVLDDGSDYSGRGSTPWVAVRFTDEAGTVVTAHLSGPGPSDLSPGEVIEVTYAREHPYVVQTDDYTNGGPNETVAAVGGVIAMIGFILGAGRLTSFLRIRSILRRGRWHHGYVSVGPPTFPLSERSILALADQAGSAMVPFITTHGGMNSGPVDLCPGRGHQVVLYQRADKELHRLTLAWPPVRERRLRGRYQRSLTPGRRSPQRSDPRSH